MKNKNKHQKHPYLAIAEKLSKKVQPYFAFVTNSEFDTRTSEIITVLVKKDQTIIHKIHFLANSQKAKRSSNLEQTLLFDPDFKFLSAALSNKEPKFSDSEIDDRHSCSIISDIINFLTMTDKTKAQAIYWENHLLGIKAAMSKIFDLDTVPQKEFFWYGSDELRSRYSGSKLNFKDEQRVKIIDTSALLFNWKEDRSIDHHSGITYHDDKFIYVGAKWKFKKLSKTGTDGKKAFNYKKIKPLAAEIKKAEKFPYIHVNGQILTMKKQGDHFSLYDDQGEVKVTHNDLLLYLLD